MRRDWRYIFYIAGVAGIYLLVTLTGPRQHDWRITLAHEDKDPYGTFALNELLPSFFTDRIIKNSYQTFYEELDSGSGALNVLVLTSNFNGGKEDVERLLNHVAAGNAALISAQSFTGPLADTLNLSITDFMFEAARQSRLEDSVALFFSPEVSGSSSRYYYSQAAVHSYFDNYDSAKVRVIAQNEFGEPVAIRVNWGEGFLLLNTTPLVFANINLLNGNNHELASAMLSFLPDRDVVWTEFYHLGRREAQTPLRYILSTEPLRWAYYLTLGTLLLFILFEAKRKQRIIPVVKPLDNTTLEFVTTLGNLYFHHGDHKNLAEKRIGSFLDRLREKYWLDSAIRTNAFGVIARKTGNDEHTTLALFQRIKSIQERDHISADELKSLNTEMEQFLAR